MGRKFIAAAGQLGPVARDETRASVVTRMIALLRQAKARGCSFVTFPEMALTTFFPRWHITDPREVVGYFEDTMPSPETQPLFDTARELGIGFYLGYCERIPGREQADHVGYNSSVLVDRSGDIVGKYRKVHLPGERKTGRRIKTPTSRTLVFCRRGPWVSSVRGDGRLVRHVVVQ